jgi:hypothetical protein
MPVIGLIGGGAGDISTRYLTAFRRGPDETREDQPWDRRGADRQPLAVMEQAAEPELSMAFF